MLQDLPEKRGPYLITQNGKARAVMQDIASYEDTQETQALLKILALGNQEIEEGKVTPVAEVARRLNTTETLKVTTPSATQIVMTRTFDAPRQLVFDAFTKPN